MRITIPAREAARHSRPILPDLQTTPPPNHAAGAAATRPRRPSCLANSPINKTAALTESYLSASI
jgi:hypothetical protein